jgi:Flp pilus assembly protein TadG
MHRGPRERGAALIEFAILAPLLVALLIGIIEFGWLFSQNIDVRHGAREGARLAATNFGTSGAIVTETCDRMDIAGTSAVTVQLTHGVGATIGDAATVEVIATPSSITGMFGAFMPATLESSIEIRLEQTPGWSSMGAASACP